MTKTLGASEDCVGIWTILSLMKRESTKPQANSKNKGTKKAHQEQAAYFEQLIQYRENEVDQKKKKERVDGSVS